MVSKKAWLGDWPIARYSNQSVTMVQNNRIETNMGEFPLPNDTRKWPE